LRNSKANRETEFERSRRILFECRVVFVSKYAHMAKIISKRFRFEFDLLERGVTRIAGVDEAGRGPLAGPVFAAAVMFPVDWMRKGLPTALRKVNDSKQLSPGIRELLFAELTSRPEILYAVASVDVAAIDEINILQASHRAMNLALMQLRPAPEHVLVDGLRVKSITLPHTPIVSGDAFSYSIAAASILAKVSRDRHMLELDRLYPGYGFAAHKGYGTEQHVAAIKALGACPIHRQSFAPFRLAQTELFG
jgi:ribonuclease HII